MFCVVTAVNTLDFRLNEKKEKKIRHAVIRTRVSDRIYTLSHRPSSKTLRNCTHSAQVNCFVLKKGQYLVTNASVVGVSVSLSRGKRGKTTRLPIVEKEGGRCCSHKNTSSAKIM
jgi:hypothetical protein